MLHNRVHWKQHDKLERTYKKPCPLFYLKMWHVAYLYSTLLRKKIIRAPSSSSNGKLTDPPTTPSFNSCLFNDRCSSPSSDFFISSTSITTLVDASGSLKEKAFCPPQRGIGLQPYYFQKCVHAFLVCIKHNQSFMMFFLIEVCYACLIMYVKLSPKSILEVR